jgi:outer membrane protein assembly factor BamB
MRTQNFKTFRYLILLGLLTLAAVLTNTSDAEDWPTYLHDNHRSGATSEQLELPLRTNWVRTTVRGPRPAWDETPALQDFWQGLYGNKSRVPIENAFRVVVEGNLLYFGSSNTNKLTCLDTESGTEQWKFFADGPIRFAPTVYNSKVYFGSDDGYVYCLNGTDGSLVWKHRASSSDELMFANGRMVSVCPVRTAVLVDNDVAYWGAGLFSGAQTGLSRYLCARNANNGAEVWTVTPPKPLQGYPLASTDNLYMPAGKSTPVMFQRTSGTNLGDFDASSNRQGGCYALLTNDGKFFFGPHYSGSGTWVGDYNSSTRAYEGVAWFYGNYLVATATYSYCSSDTTLSKINRSNQEVLWSISTPYRYGLILAGDTIFAGGEDEVAALSTTDGSVLWSASVNGRVHGLAVANGSLFVSTNQGAIYSFVEFKGDLDADNDVDFIDFAMFALQWMETGCGDCSGADLAIDDGQVDLWDLQAFAENWLADLN